MPVTPYWLPASPACSEKMHVSSSSAATASSSAHAYMLPRYRVGGSRPRHLVEEKVGVVAQPLRHQAVEDERGWGAGRGAKAQKLGAERGTKTCQPGHAMVPQPCIGSHRSLF